MDPRFFRFWTNWFLNGTYSRRQLEALAQWIASGFAGDDRLKTIFEQAYGLGPFVPSSQDYALMWRQAADAFHQSWLQFLEALQCVPRSEYDAVRTRLEDLEAQTARQAATIEKLRLELASSRLSRGDAVHGFQELLELQRQQFEDLGETFARMLASKSGTEGSDR